MKGTIERYLDRVMAVADVRDAARERQIREELRDHLEQKVDALKSEGYSGSEALVKAVEDHGNAVVVGYRLRPWRFLDVRLRGTARGVIAIGPKARGIVAIGGLAMGVFAFGGVAIGAFSFGGLALAALLAWGGAAAGTIAYGGLAIGLVAFGGMAIGGIAAGGAAAGIWVPGAGATMWSLLNWETAPHWWRSIGYLFSFDPRSPNDQSAFMRMTFTLTGLTFVILVAGMVLQTIMMVREGKRVCAIDPSTSE